MLRWIMDQLILHDGEKGKMGSLPNSLTGNCVNAKFGMRVVVAHQIL